jgi:hypothetical protein
MQLNTSAGIIVELKPWYFLSGLIGKWFKK